MAGQMVKEGVLARYRDEVKTGALVTRDTARNALGANVDGYVIPMFHSQTAIADNPALVSEPPKTFEKLVAWTKANPKKFGYNGIKGGMLGVAFVFGWIYAHSPNPQQLMEGPYDPKVKESWGPRARQAQGVQSERRHHARQCRHAGHAEPREIAMGPVWVDMFYTWQADGKLPPTMRLQLIAPGLPSQPMYYVIPQKAANMEAAKKFVEFATSPAIQAEGIVKRFNWYPGIDAQHVQAHLDRAVWEKLFNDIPPQDLATKGKSMPIAEYFKEIQEAYEHQVAN